MFLKVADVLINCVSKVTTSKTKDRRYIFKDLLYPLIERNGKHM